MSTKEKLLKVAKKMLDLVKSNPEVLGKMADAPMAKPSLHDYWKMLEGHDWYTHFSDDYNVEMKGKQKEEALKDLGEKSSPEHSQMFDAFKAHHTGRVTGKHSPKPEKPSI